MNFTYDAYSRLIALVAEKGHTFESYTSWEKSTKPCILRHDVDNDLEKAAEFAEFEADLLNKYGGGGIYLFCSCYI